MRPGGVSVWAVPALLVACAQPVAPEPEPVPEPMVTTSAAVAAEPTLPQITLANRIKQEGWLVRFWEQLTPAQRRRVVTRLRQHIPPLAREEAEAAPIWDGLGLPERDALIFVGRLPKP